MNSSLFGKSQMFEAFIRSAQYFVRLKAQQDIWDHLGRFIMTYFPAEWVAFAQRDPAGEISINYCTLSDKTAAQSILTTEARALIADVLDSGFLVSQVIRTPAPSMTVFLPIVKGYQTAHVMLIGHKTTDPLPNEQLNVYLAIAGLAGTTLERLQNERKLARYRAHLEELVKELRESEEKFRLVADFTFDWEVWIDPAGNYVYVSPSCERMTGHRAEEFYRDPELMSRIVHPDDLAGFRHHMDLCVKNISNSSGIDFRILTASGETRWISHLCQPVFGDNGEWLGQRANNRDITERKRAEEALKEETQQAELYLDLMGHDISNMHQIIMGNLEIVQGIMEMEGHLDSSGKEMIDISLATLLRSAKLIENVRNIQKLRSGECQFEKMDLDWVLSDAIKGYANLPGRDISIDYSHVHGCYVMANSVLKDIFNNIFDNAAKHCEDPVRINVSLCKTTQHGNSYYRVAVEDNGHGVPDDMKTSIFGRMKRGKSIAMGTGLGLFIVRSLVESYKGYVWVEDRVKGDYTKGARFVVMLPAIDY